MVTRVTPNSPAAAAGLAAGDVIRSVDGDEVQNSRDALNRIAAKAPGTAISVGVIRAGKRLEVRVTVAERPDQSPT